MRPKSMATVVSPSPSPEVSLICRSVESTVISLTDLIKVVLPALNGPVMTILTDCIVATSQVLDAVDDLQKRVLVDPAVESDPAHAGLGDLVDTRSRPSGAVTLRAGQGRELVAEAGVEFEPRVDGDVFEVVGRG